MNGVLNAVSDGIPGEYNIIVFPGIPVSAGTAETAPTHTERIAELDGTEQNGRY